MPYPDPLREYVEFCRLDGPCNDKWRGHLDNVNKMKITIRIKTKKIRVEIFEKGDFVYDDKWRGHLDSVNNTKLTIRIKTKTICVEIFEKGDFIYELFAL